ncbi:hypothetical protein A0H81_00791 [Grifola frondosa]|uniref:Uncharacterized protein n=1 Tax=Grifola frondosa TaxID=5627 RepID=A0A1C7MSU9_GRIFR|nr:hypothetical protein A0H81_00791 [Grifola frondosa]
MASALPYLYDDDPESDFEDGLRNNTAVHHEPAHYRPPFPGPNNPLSQAPPFAIPAMIPYPISYPFAPPPAAAPPMASRRSSFRPPHTSLDDSPFPADSLSSPHFFMTSREEILPAAHPSGDFDPAFPQSRFSDEPPNWPWHDPRIPQHARSQSAHYPSTTSRISSARVIPIPPPMSVASSQAVHPPIPSRNPHPPPPPRSARPISTTQLDDSPPPSAASPPSATPTATPSEPALEAEPSASVKVTPSALKNDRPVFPARNISAPELRPPPPPTDVPPRPSTAPGPTPTHVVQRKLSKKPSIATAPRDLDRIDELDETNPLGFTWHHDGPYEAIAKSQSQHDLAEEVASKKPKQSRQRSDESTTTRNVGQPFDPSVPLGIAPGQIFPSLFPFQPPPQQTGASPQTTEQNEFNPYDSAAQNVPSRGSAGAPARMQTTASPPAQYSNIYMLSPPPPAAPIPEWPPRLQRRYLERGQDENEAPTGSARPSEPQTSPPSRPPRMAPTVTPPQQSNHGPSAPSMDAPLPNPHSPTTASPSAPLLNPHPPASISQSNLPPSNVLPRPDIALPPRRTETNTSHPPPRYLPKRLVMPTPLQPQPQQYPSQTQAAPVPAPAAQPDPRHALHRMHPPPHKPRAGGGDPNEPGPKPAPQAAHHARRRPSVKTSAAMFAARVRFAEPEVKQAAPAKGTKKRTPSKEVVQPVAAAVWARDMVKEAELEREASRRSTKLSGRKLSKRR